jgi:hypothetical protein
VTPEDEGFIFLLRGFETIENAVIPVDRPPGDIFDAELLDGILQLFEGGDRFRRRELFSSR